MSRLLNHIAAGHTFGLVPKKLQEHYGIVLSTSTVRAITEHHAGQIYQAEERITDLKDIPEDADLFAPTTL